MKKIAIGALSYFAMSAAISAVIADSELNTFSAGTAAKASEVNHNFSILKSGINDLATSIEQLSTRVSELESSSEVVSSVAGRCFRLTSYEVEIARNDDANQQSPWMSQNGYIPGLQVKNGYVFFDLDSGSGRINVRRDTVNQYFVETGGGSFSRADAGEAGDYTHTEYTNHNVTWSQSGSKVTTYRDRGGEGIEELNFTASMDGSILFGTDIETSAFESGSKNGSVEIFMLNEMGCAEATQGEASFPAQ